MKALRVVLLLAMCSNPLAAQKVKRCPGTPIDTSAIAGPVYRDCQVDKPAKLRGTPPRPKWSPSTSEVSDGRCFRAAFRFIVDESGAILPGTIEVSSSNNAGFENAVRGTLFQLQYDPAMLDGQPVRQVVTHKQSMGIRVVVSSSPTRGAAPRAPVGC